MRTPLAIATLLIAGLASPGSALDVGLGGGGVGAGASLGGGGVSVGAGASLGGGEVQAGAGATLGNGGRGASPGGGSAGVNGGVTAGGGGVQAGAGATLGGTSASVGVGGSGTGRSASPGDETASAGISANAGVGQTGNGRGAGRGAGAAGVGGVAPSGDVSSVGVAGARRGASSRSEQARSTASLGRASSFRTEDMTGPAIPLPGRLLPFDIHEPGSPAPRAMPLRSAIPMRPTYRPILSACRAALAEAAEPYGATKVDVAVTGAPRKSSNGGLSAPVEARIVYSRSGRVQVRQARVTCQFDAGGQVVAAL